MEHLQGILLMVWAIPILVKEVFGWSGFYPRRSTELDNVVRVVRLDRQTETVKYMYIQYNQLLQTSSHSVYVCVFRQKMSYYLLYI